MRKEDAFELGHFSRKHGYKGQLVAVFDTDRPEAYTELESVFVERHGELIPFFIEEISRNSKGHFILSLEDIEPDEAEELVGREIWLPLSFLPPLAGKSFYYHEVIGFSVYDDSNQLIGTLKQMLDGAGQSLFQIEGEKGESILVPAVDDFIMELNRKEKILRLSLPPGLLELYA